MRWPLAIIFFISINALAQRGSINGQLYWTPDQTTSSSFESNITYKDKPVEIIVFEQVTRDEVLVVDGQIQKIEANEVARVFCKWNGTFKLKVPPGSYSVFAYVDGSYFGNLVDNQGNLSPANVTKKNNAWVTITMNP